MRFGSPRRGPRTYPRGSPSSWTVHDLRWFGGGPRRRNNFQPKSRFGKMDQRLGFVWDCFWHAVGSLQHAISSYARIGAWTGTLAREGPARVEEPRSEPATAAAEHRSAHRLVLDWTSTPPGTARTSRGDQNIDSSTQFLQHQNQSLLPWLRNIDLHIDWSSTPPGTARTSRSDQILDSSTPLLQRQNQSLLPWFRNIDPHHPV